MDVILYNKTSKIETKINQLIEPRMLFDPSVSYIRYTLVIKDGVLYRFTSAHNGAWTGTDVEEVTYGVKQDLILTQNLAPKFHIGGISIRDTGWTYDDNDNPKRVSTIEGYTIHLRPGDVIGLTGGYDDARYYIGYRRPNGTYVARGWLTSDFTVTAEADYVINIEAVPEATVKDVSDLAGRFKCITFRNVNDIYGQIKENSILSENFNPPFHIGNISIRTTGWTYESSATRVCTVEGYTMHLRPGDVIGLTDYEVARYYLGFRYADGTYGVKGWNTSDFTVVDEGDYVFNIEGVPVATVTDASDLASLFKCRITRTIDDIYGQIIEVDERQKEYIDIQDESVIAKIIALEPDIYGMGSHLLNPSSPKFLMHRGLSARAPENTVPAFILAGQGGAFGIETDIQETSDGEFVCLHDSTVDRTTDGTGTVSEMTLAEVMAVTIDSGSNIAQYQNLKIPTMLEYLQVCKRYGCVPIVEIKNVRNYDAFIGEIKKFGILDSCIFLTGAGGPVINALRQYTNAMIAMLTYSSSDHISIVNNMKKYKNVAMDFNLSSLTDELIMTCHQANMPVFVWTSDSIADSEALFNRGIDAVTSNMLTHLPKEITVSGSTPVILAEPDIQYICGEVTSLSFTPSASGICDVRFTSGATATALTLPSTVKMPDGFDPANLEAGTVYEINVVDGVYGTVMSWSV